MLPGRPILLLKANPSHDERIRFARAPQRESEPGAPNPGGSGPGETRPAAALRPGESPDHLAVAQLWALFEALDHPPLLKAERAIPAGARWITVRPNGPGTEGHPVLIRPSGDGAYRVIGGAGGKLNYLKLTGVRSEEEYAARARESAKARRDQAKERAKRDRAAGIAGEKAKVRDQLRLSGQVAKEGFVRAVSEALGWTPEQTRFREEDHQDKPAGQVARLAAEHFDKLFKTAAEAVRIGRERLLADADLRSEAGFGARGDGVHGADRAEAEPLLGPPENDPGAVSVADLDPAIGADAPERGMGFRPDYEKRARARGATPEDIQDEAAAVPPAEGARKAPKPPPPPTKGDGGAEPAPNQPDLPGTGAAQPAETGPDMDGRLGEATEAVREPLGPRVDPRARATGRQAAALLRADRELRAKLKEVRGRAREVAGAKTADDLPKAFVLEVDGEAVDEAVRRGVEEDLRTLRTQGFLDAAREHGAGEARKHLAAGAFHSANALALAAGGATLLDRSAVDVLGPAGAAQALAHRLARDLSPAELAEVREAMGRHHVTHYMARSEEALEEARQLQEEASEIQLGEAESGHDLALAQELNGRRRDLVRRARATLARALGEMETNAALVAALDRPKRDRITVPLGQVAPADAIARLRALGLERGDYTIERAGGQNLALVIHGEAIGKMTSPVSRADIDRVNGSLAIMRGLDDEEGWLPKGVARRPDWGRDAPVGAAPRLARHFPQSPPDVRQAVRDYIGGRAADGDHPADILAGLLSETTVQRAGGDRAAFFAAVEEAAPLHDAEGRVVRAEAYADRFEAMADEFAARAYGGARAPIHRQPLAEDATSAEALHRALAAEPAAALAFKPVGELTAEEQGAVRQFFAREYGARDAEAAAKRARVEALDREEPEKETDGLFGRGTNPEWTRWKGERDEAAQAASDAEFGWGRYTAAMGGPEAAYQAMQDVLRGRAVEAFAREHNKLRPAAPLRVGRAAIRGDLDHLDAVDPQARARREADRRELADRLRNRVAGRYAAGSVHDRMAAAREAEEAAAQAQMGLFGDEPAASGGEGEAEALPENDAPMGPGERATVGHAAERALAGLVARTGGMWDPRQRQTPLYAPAMDGKYIARQRAVKLIDRNRRVVLGMGVGSGKAQPVHSRILTPTGWTTMGELRVGDQVLAGDGTVCRVTGVFPQGVRPVFRVVMSDGATAECCDEHLWLTQTQKERRPRVRPLLEIQRDLAEAKRVGSRRHTVPLVGPLQMTPQAVPLDPYLVGLLLGDGGFTKPGAVMFTTWDREVAAAVQAALPEGVRMLADTVVDGTTSFRLASEQRGCGIKNPVLDVLCLLGLHGCASAEKFIPNEYLYNEAAVRLAVLQGLIDTDGFVGAEGHTVSFTTVSPRLRDGVVFLTRSLGGIATVTEARTRHKHDEEAGKGQLAFTVRLRLPPAVPPARLVRKARWVIPRGKYAPRCRFIERIEPAGDAECRCISVDHPSRLYVTDDLIVTHNTGISIGAFAHLQAQGKAKRGLFLVPSVVQGQFHGEALSMLEPGQFSWHARPGAPRDERLAAMRDSSGHDFVVLTHQGFRDDVLHLAARHDGTTPEAVADRIEAMAPPERADFLRDTLAREGIGFDYLAVDEGHNLLNRKGKEDSRLANVVDAVSRHTGTYVNMTADPVKNDVSEAFDTLAKMDPDRYRDRAAFLRRYGPDTDGAREGLRRELARHYYTSSISPGVAAHKKEVRVDLHPEDRARVESIQRAAGRARLARMEGRVDVAALRDLSPQSFEGVEPERHEEVARGLADAVGVLRDSALRRAISGRGKVDVVSRLAGERRGTPGVVFCHHLDQVDRMAERLRAEGHKVLTLTGKHGAKEKAATIDAFRREGGVLLASDAGAVGANLQTGKWLAQFDTPMTATVHAQRNGRIHRIGQTQDVELLDLVADHPEERRARDRLARKYGLREIVTSPLDGLDDTGLAGTLARVRAGRDDAAPAAPRPRAESSLTPEPAPQRAPEVEPALL